MAKSDNLRKARAEKNDEFYTQLSDIEKELSHYKAYFKGKTVFCNCDDPYESNFFKYFAMNFNFLGLKKLIATCYDSSPVAGEQLSLFPDKRPYKIEISEVTDENGNMKMVAGDIMLPPGKIPFVMSQDDLCYYEYMDGDGFASRMIVGENGKPTCEMVMDDGSVSVGSYDLVPLLEDFITEHPDFSYRGARAVLAFTGYQGVLGYRTDPSYESSNPNYEADKEMVRQVAQCLRDNGWELASHSWGHINFGKRSFEDVKTDSDKWASRVESLIGKTDILLYPFGSDVGDWHPYTMENEKYAYLHELGFRYFCNVDSSQYWVQFGSDYLRQGRRNLDGYRMYYDLPETNPEKDHLSDLFDVTQVFDRERPVPVAPMN